ncbi:Small heat shock protein HSP [Parasponia andersonii]|uniref:Small heat shock protein HSP n=1 Tax=Parasponia andersonii TaxID=3476 RepID=A0A2P5DC16_PARAD|nr:Small heat shock protein HSP [Parasponia andersonii]
MDLEGSSLQTERETAAYSVADAASFSTLSPSKFETNSRIFPSPTHSLLRPFFPHFIGKIRRSSGRRPRRHTFRADVPGMKKEEVKVEVEDDRVLQISGERKMEKEDKNDTWHRVERSSGKFLRRLRLPKNAQQDQIKAAMENGVLTVTVPKEEIERPDVKSIEISG